MIFTVVHYNTPELITCCISSVLKNYNDAKIIVFENSDRRKFENLFGSSVEIIDNSRGKFLDFNSEIANLIKENSLDALEIKKAESEVSNFGSFKHSISVQYLIDNINEDFILLDSDILLKKRLDVELGDNVAICDYNQNRIFPFIVKFNNNLLKKHNIIFCDRKHILPVKSIPSYDTGGYFLTQVKANNLSLQKINFEDYVVHYGNGSWKENGNKRSSLKTYKMDKFEWMNKFKSLWWN